MRHRYQELDSALMRQQIGEIDPEELNLLNKSGKVTYSRSDKGPAQLKATSPYGLGEMLLTSSCCLFAAYGQFKLGANKVFLLGSFMPIFFLSFIRRQRINEDELQSGYRWILAYRAALCEREAHKDLVPVRATLSKHMGASDFTLYDLEEQIVTSIAEGKFWENLFI